MRERGRREEKHTRQLGVSPFKKWNRSDLSIRPNSSIEHQHFPPNRNSSLFLRPSLLRSFFSSFFLLLYLSHSPSPLARPVYTPNKGGHTDVNIYELCITVTVFQALFNIDIGSAVARYQITLHVSSFSSSTWKNVEQSPNEAQVTLPIRHSLSIRDTDRSVPPTFGPLEESSPTITMHPLLVESNEITVHAR